MKSKQFNKITPDKAKLDRALEAAQIQKLYASAAKDRQEARNSMQESLSPIKKAVRPPWVKLNR
jgi:hypothetical protein